MNLMTCNYKFKKTWFFTMTFLIILIASNIRILFISEMKNKFVLSDFVIY